MTSPSPATPFPAEEPVRFERLDVFVRGLEVEAGIGVYDHEQGRLQRLVIDVATLRTVHENIVKTLTDVRQANQDGLVMRQKALTELSDMRQQMLGASAPRAEVALPVR